MYRMKDRVRFSETDEDMKMTLTAVVDCLQNCATFHSDDAGVGMRYLGERNACWITLTWRILLHEMPEYGQHIEVETRPYDFVHSFGKRSFQIRDEAGRVLVSADSRWAFYDRAAGKHVKPFPEVLEAYGSDEPFPMDPPDRRRILIPEGMREEEAFVVGREHLDSNGHVNNVQYIRMAGRFLPPDIGEFRAEYHRQARSGDRICPRVGQDGESTVVVLAGEDGGKYAVISARGRKQQERPETDAESSAAG